MKTKKLLIFAAVFVGLALVILVFENPFGQSEYQKKVRTAVPLFPKFDKAAVEKIEIVADSTVTTLKKENGQWLVDSMDNYPADAASVDELLNKVSEFKNTERVSNNPDKQAEFEVDSTGIDVKLMDGSDAVLVHLFVGKNTPGFLSSYVRAADSNDVYIAQGALQTVFDKGTQSWKDRTVFDFNKGNVLQLNITSSEETVELRLDDDGKWQMLQPIASAVKQSEVDSLLTAFSQLDTDDFAEAKDALDEYGLASPESSISAVLNDGTTATLHIGKEEDGKRYVKRDDKDNIFRLYTSNVNRLIKKSETLKEEAPAPETEAATPTE